MEKPLHGTTYSHPFLLLLFLLAGCLGCPYLLRAQNTKLIVNSGTNWIVAGGTLVLNTTDLQADGQFDAGAAGVWLTGAGNTTISGSGVPLIQTLTINTSAVSILTLYNTLQVSGALTFQNGVIELNNNQVQLLTGAVLQSEGETSHITGIAGGKVTATASGVTNPNQLNIGNLGAALTTGANLGNLSLARIHQPATNPVNSSLHGIQRTYLVQPQNNTALNATLRFYYLDEELNGGDASTLALWQSTDGVTWTQIGADTRNAVSKYVEKSGVATLSYFTLSDAADPLPLTLLSFKANCQEDFVLIQWQTGSEDNIDHFVIQKSEDGLQWREIGTIGAFDDPLGASYSFKDPSPEASAFYRLEIVEKPGNSSYSPVFRGGCSDIAMPFLVYPNPAQGEAVAKVGVRSTVSGTIQILNTEGQLLYSSGWNLQPGNNQYLLPVSTLSHGTYIVKVLLPGTVLQTKLIKE